MKFNEEQEKKKQLQRPKWTEKIYMHGTDYDGATSKMARQ